MLEHVPAWLGHALRNLRAGHAKLVIVQQDLALTDDRLHLSSPAFADGGVLPVRFTADGEGVSPPLVWTGTPPGTSSLALLVEDPDAPAPSPLVHAVVWRIAAGDAVLAEGAIAPGSAAEGDGHAIGRNSFGAQGWLPPDPPTGHGVHDYVFQLFALSDTPDLGSEPTRAALVEAIRGRVLAAGMLVGTYARGEPAAVPAGDAAMVAQA